MPIRRTKVEPPKFGIFGHEALNSLLASTATRLVCLTKVSRSVVHPPRHLQTAAFTAVAAAHCLSSHISSDLSVLSEKPTKPHKSFELSDEALVEVRS
jgi:hypothetical protein